MGIEEFYIFESSVEIILACMALSGHDEDDICAAKAKFEVGAPISDHERTAFNAFLRILTQPEPDEKDRVWELAVRMRKPGTPVLNWKRGEPIQI